MDESSSDDEMLDEELMDKIKLAKTQLEENPIYYDGHLNYISLLKEAGELDKLRDARNQMNEVYPLTPDIWLEWINDEIRICTSDEERNNIIALFKRAVKDYTSVRLWLEYIMFMVGGGDNEATRGVMEEALMEVGTHVAEGLLVWQSVFVFETQVFAAIGEPEDNEEKLKQQDMIKKKVQKLYKRQFRVPLLNMDKESILEEASPWFDGDIEPFMINELDKTIKKLKTRTPFEESLLKVNDDVEKLVAYRLYLEHLKTLKENPVDVQSLYERAITDVPLDASLWEEYILYTMEKFPNSDYLILPICERSLRNCPWSAALIELNISGLQMCEENLSEDLDLRIKKCLDKGLKSGVQYGSEITRMWMSYLVFLRRRIQWEEPDHEKNYELFKESCLTAIDSIDKLFGEEGDIDCVIPRFLAQIEAEFGHNMEGARDLWNDTILQRNNNFKNANMWIEFITLERSFGSHKHCRKIFKRALERVWDNIEIIVNAFKKFEQEVGTYETMADFKKRCSDRMVHVKKRDAELALKEEKNQWKNKKDKFNKNQRTKEKVSSEKWGKLSKTTEIKHNQKKKEDNEVSKITLDSNIERSSVPTGLKNDVAPPPGFTHDGPPPPGFQPDVMAPPGYQSDVLPPPGFNSSPNKSSKRPSDSDESRSPKKPKVNPTHGETVAHDDSENPKTVFLSNLDFDTTEDEIKEAVAACGEIKSLRLAKDFKGRSKGFGYLVFENQLSVDAALKIDRTKVKGRPMYISPCNPDKEKSSQFKYSTKLEKEKLFVRGLPKDYDENKIKEIFEPHGKIKEFRLVTFRNGYSKGNCYITYFDEKTAENVCKNMHNKEIEDKKISVMISDPSKSLLNQPEMKPKQISTASMRPKLSFVPRSLMTKSQPKPTANIKSGVGKSNADFRNMLLKK